MLIGKLIILKVKRRRGRVFWKLRCELGATAQDKIPSFEGWVWIHGIKLKTLPRPGEDVGTEPHLDALQQLQCELLSWKCLG